MRQFSLIDVFGWTAIFAIWAALWPWSLANNVESVAVAVGIAGTIATMWRFNRKCGAWFSFAYAACLFSIIDFIKGPGIKSNPSFINTPEERIFFSLVDGCWFGFILGGLLFLIVIAVTGILDLLKRRLA